MTDRLLVGPFLTRSEAAAIAGVPPAQLRHRPDLVKIGGRQLPEVYCRFQFDSGGIRRDIGVVVLAMHGRFDDLTIADWLVRTNPALLGESPLDRLNRTRSPAGVLDALAIEPPSPAPVPVAAEPASRHLHQPVEFRRPRWRMVRQPGTLH